MTKPRKSGSRIRKTRGREKTRTTNRAGNVPPEVLRVLAEAQALTRPGYYDPQEAMRVKLALDGVLLNVERANQAAEAEHQAEEAKYFEWLEANIPEMFRNTGRPHWVESETVQEQDRLLIKEFEEMLARNVAANAGKKYRASQKTYSDLADKYGDSDQETIKRRVMRARRRQKAIQDMLSIVNPIRKKERDRMNTHTRRQQILEGFRRILKAK